MSQSQSAHILVVDDNPDMRRLLQRMAQSVGYPVVVAADGESALANAAQNPPLAVLLDVSMPGMDGLEVVRRLRRFDQNTPVILLAPSDSPNLCQTAEHLGVVCVVEYPFDYAELCETAIAALDPG